MAYENMLKVNYSDIKMEWKKKLNNLKLAYSQKLFFFLFGERNLLQTKIKRV
jgi:hypothetical protein